jgi:hypothetical protein
MTKTLFRRLAWVALPAFLSGSAFAQVVPLIPSGRINPIIGLPKSLPSPLTGPYSGAITNLPTVAIPQIALPTALPVLPVSAKIELVSPTAIVAMIPASATLPGPLTKVTIARFSAAAEGTPTKPVKPETAAQKAEKLDELFDGKGKLPKNELPESPRPGRHISLPESDLLDEIGI